MSSAEDSSQGVLLPRALGPVAHAGMSAFKVLEASGTTVWFRSWGRKAHMDRIWSWA